MLQKLILGDDHEVQLPRTRREAFRFYSKMHFGKLMACGVLTSLFFLPALLWLYSANYTKSQQLEALLSADGGREAYGQILLQHAGSDFLVLIPLVAIFFVGLAGLFGLCKRMAFYQSSGYREYFLAIQRNGFQSALCGLLFGLSLFFLSYNVTYYQVSTLSAVARGLLVGFSILQFVVVSIITVYLMCGIAVYTNTARQHLINAMKFTFALFWKNLAVAVLGAFPMVLTVLIPSPWQLILLSLLPLFYMGFAVLALICYCAGVFDRYINPMLGAEYVGLGLAGEDP